MKTDKETYHEYLYRMMNIGSQADIEAEAIIQYVIDGIDDLESNKAILYGSTTISEMKKRLDVYQTMKTKSKAKLSNKPAVNTKSIGEAT